LIARADVAISAGGTTCYELAAARVPAAAVAVEPHQVLWIESLERAGTLLRLDRDGEMDVSVIDRLLGDGDAARRDGGRLREADARSGAPGIAARVQRLLARRAVA